MKHARRIPLALFAACLAASTPYSWGAGRDAATAGEPMRKPGRTYPELIEIFNYVPMATGMVRIPLPKVFIGDVVLSDLGNADAASGTSSDSSRVRVVRWLAPTDPIEAVIDPSGTTPR
jgi:hypothetical protein